MAQTTADSYAIEDFEDAAKGRARLVAEAIASFNAHAMNGQGPITSYKSPTYAGTTYLSDIIARPTRERQAIQLILVYMINDFGVSVVSWTGCQHYLGCSPVFDDEFPNTCRCAGITVDGRYLGSLPIYYHHIHWPHKAPLVIHGSHYNFMESTRTSSSQVCGDEYNQLRHFGW
jgi:hypothetical protein